MSLAGVSALILDDNAHMRGLLRVILASFGFELPGPPLPFASAFAIASVEWSIPLDDACAGYAWAWCEAQVAAAVKLVPLGHTAGQRVLLALGDQIAAAVAIPAVLYMMLDPSQRRRLRDQRTRRQIGR